MSHQPVVTVLLPVFNGAEFLRKAIDSVLESSFPDFELLVIDDGSTDDSLAIIRSFRDARVRLVVHDRNRGLIASLNEGLDAARGRYVARMDADDIMLPDRLAKQVAALEHDPGLGMVAAHVAFLNADGELTGSWDTDRATPDEGSIRAMLPRTNCLAHPTVMLRKSAFAGLRYSAAQPNMEDWDLWLRFLAQGGRIGKIPDILLHYRSHPASIMAGQTAQVPLAARLLQGRWRFLRGRPWLGLFNIVGRKVWSAQFRTLISALLHIRLPALARDLYRLFTYAPWEVVHEDRLLRATLEAWKGDHLFNFPYYGIGGAERVHADIVATVKAKRPLVIISGFSSSDANRPAFERSAITLELPRLLHHPFTRRKAHMRISAALNARAHPVLFASLSAVFFDLLPYLDEKVRCFYLQHAFLFQPDGNAQHKRWLRSFGRLEAMLFVSGRAMREYDRFLFANNVPRVGRSKLKLMPNAVHRFGQVHPHDRIGVLFVGRDSEEKRLDLFLDLATNLHAAKPGTFQFTVTGPPERVFAGVQFTGPVADPAELGSIYAAHDILVITSHREGFPMVIMEAMAHGLAILSTPVGDVPHRLDTHVAYITSTVDRDQVIKEMTGWLKSIAHDPSALRSMRKAALEQAQQEFSMEAFAVRYRSLFISPDASA